MTGRFVRSPRSPAPDAPPFRWTQRSAGSACSCAYRRRFGCRVCILRDQEKPNTSNWMESDYRRPQDASQLQCERFRVTINSLIRCQNGKPRLYKAEVIHRRGPWRSVSAHHHRSPLGPARRWRNRRNSVRHERGVSSYPTSGCAPQVMKDSPGDGSSTGMLAPGAKSIGVVGPSSVPFDR